MFWELSDPSFSQVDELTKKFVKSAEDMCKAKEKEITGGLDAVSHLHSEFILQEYIAFKNLHLGDYPLISEYLLLDSRIKRAYAMFLL